MKIIVTGALGYWGSALIPILAQRFPKTPLILMDNLAAQQYHVLRSLPNDPNIQFLAWDILTADFDSLLDSGDIVIHLAALVNPTWSYQFQTEIHKVNVIGTQHVADACARNHSQMFFPSTTSLYGISSNEIREDNAPESIVPQSPYAESKLKGEQYLSALGRTEGLRYIILRCATLFGFSPGIRYRTAVNRFCWQAYSHLPVTVWKTAWQQWRPYLAICDAVEAVIHLIESNHFTNEMLHASSLHSTPEIICQSIREYAPDLTVNFVESRVMNQLSYKISCQKLQSHGLTFQGDLKTGIDSVFSNLPKLALIHPSISPKG